MLQRWYPIHNFRRFEQAADRFTRVIPSSVKVNTDRSWAVPLDVVEDDGQIVVKASLPGLQVEDIDVTIEDGVLTITAETSTESEDNNENYLVRERRSGKFRRALRLPKTADADKADPKFEHGVLTITLPKLEEAKPKRLSITAAN